MTRRNYDEKMGKTDTEKGIGGTVMCCMLAGMTACSNNQQLQ